MCQIGNPTRTKGDNYETINGICRFQVKFLRIKNNQLF